MRARQPHSSLDRQSCQLAFTITYIRNLVPTRHIEIYVVVFGPSRGYGILVEVNKEFVEISQFT